MRDNIGTNDSFVTVRVGDPSFWNEKKRKVFGTSSHVCLQPWIDGVWTA